MPDRSHNRLKVRQPKSIYLIYIFFVITALAYLYLSYRNGLIVKNHAHDMMKLFLINASIALPELVIWGIAFMSSIRLKEYALKIKGSKDGQSINYLANSMIMMSVYVVLITTSTSVVYIFKSSNSLRTIIGLENFIPLAAALSAAGLLLAGAIKLNDLVPIKIRMQTQIYLTSFFALVVILFAWHFYKLEPNLRPQNGVPRFIFSDNFLMLTYILPYIIAWSMGAFACFSIANYSRIISGSIYKTLFKDLYRGILLVFVCTFVAQLFIISNFNLNRFSLWLIIIYAVLILATFGFILIYKGSQSLSKIEDF
jgi:hypothetical protein